MSDAQPISLLLERQNRFSRELIDFREGQAQLFRILTRAVEANGRELAGIREELAGLRREVGALAAEQAALAIRVDEAMMRAARADRRLDEQEDRPGPAAPTGSA
jgi:hypothetical protein